MKIACIGAGPAGLYFSLLMKKAHPEVEIVVHERNRPDDTFGWGVVFSDETLGGFEAADPESMAAIRAEFAYWTDIETFVGDRRTVSTGHGFCGLARKTLLQIFHQRCLEVGVDLRFETEIASLADVDDADLIIGADGINSMIRGLHEDHFRPSIDWRKCKFTWLGTDKPLKAFTFVFRENEHGLFQVHAYPFQVGENAMSTWIVECREDVWARAGLDKASEEDTVAYMRELFGDHLEGYQLLTNRSIWRTFPTITCEQWYKDNMVLLGDSVHTAHFSIGSGTKLAMEGAMALCDAFSEVGLHDIPGTLAYYQESRLVETIKLQKAAQTSLEWFENSARYMSQDPLQFTFNLMTRSKRITYDNLKLRDPALVDSVTEWWNQENGTPLDSLGGQPAPVFTPLKLRELELCNRLVVSPMCQYSADDGMPGDWHLVHLGGMGIGGAGLVMCEATGISPEGRITYGCTGIWSQQQADAWRRIVDFVHANGASKVGMQLSHAGRKASCSLPWDGDRPLTDDTAWPTVGPSAAPFGDGWPTPSEMNAEDMRRVREQYVAATRLSLDAGFDLLEIHMAHGYLLSSFLSPLSNHRSDEYGGSLEARLRFPLEVLRDVRAAWPADKPLSVRISATDWLDDGGGQTVADSVAISRAFQAEGCDLIDVSSAGNSPESAPVYGRMYQVPMAEAIRHETGGPVMAVGGIQGADHANTVLAAGRADLCALARPHLIHPHLSLQASIDYDYADMQWPRQYLPAKPRPR
ncbi:MAG: anthraniloyl-CoA monooxygenase [Planctomycetota bacterium]|jgi:anthraniloyl-CoA monooxygenase